MFETDIHIIACLQQGIGRKAALRALLPRNQVAGLYTTKADSRADLAPVVRGPRLEYAIRYDPGEVFEGPAVRSFAR
ncbi:uncharacterized protein TRAVEDRAFT_49521 [Trametes versicolor FP-101664 SS1]|uniref:uncharacterized protein n=1 Tax=Trametes versicolor (strain FP-101664) TaxID=717944 RepID=UPI000462354B|nr:uncharacterized protein TRAVEDRAFT_49521 [Trametes versicolor FP-101664 SS1]EIW56702.1 hypothetical protein TRAVEDRAFT_49521 [Trametes versicolor FP-101664 SS1]